MNITTEFESEHDDCPSSTTKQHEITSELLEGIWDFIVNDFPQRSKELSVLPKEFNRTLLQQAYEKEKLTTGRRILHSSQKKKDQSEKQQQQLTSSPSSEYWKSKGKVSLEFLKEHGKCQDHIRPDISTIPNAGRGAFATRDLPKGTVVGYAPISPYCNPWY